MKLTNLTLQNLINIQNIYWKPIVGESIVDSENYIILVPKKLAINFFDEFCYSIDFRNLFDYTEKEKLDIVKLNETYISGPSSPIIPPKENFINEISYNLQNNIIQGKQTNNKQINFDEFKLDDWYEYIFKKIKNNRKLISKNLDNETKISLLGTLIIKNLEDTYYYDDILNEFKFRFGLD